MTTDKQLWVLLLSIASLAFAAAQDDSNITTTNEASRNGKG